LRIIVKSLKVIVIAFLVLALLVGLASFAVLKWPQLVLNPRVLGTIVTLTGRFGMVLHWDKMQVQIRSRGLFHKHFDFQFDNLCFSYAANRRSGCFQNLSLAADIAWLPTGLKIREWGPLVIEKGNVALHLEEAKKEIENWLQLNIPDLTLPQYLKATFLKRISIDLDDVIIWRGDEILFSGTSRLTGEADERGRIQQFDFHTTVHPGFATPSGTLDVKVLSPSFFHENDWTMTGVGNFKMDPDLSGRVDGVLTPLRPQVYSAQVDASVKKRSTVSDMKLRATFQKGRLNGVFGGNAKGFSRKIQKLTAHDCDFDLREVEKVSDRMRLSLDCPVLVDLTPLRLPSATFKDLVTIPYNLDLRVKSDLETSLYPSVDKPVSGSLTLILNTLSQDLLTARGNTQTRFAGIPSQYPRGWQTKTLLDVVLSIPEFQKLVKALNRTAFPVFAPLNPLAGTVDLKLTGEADIAHNRGKLPVEFTTKLRSKDQIFDTDGKGDLTYQFVKKTTQTDLVMDLTLSDLVLSLPRFGYTALPSLFPDPRMKDPSKTPAQKRGDLRYRLKIKTPPEKPARFVSNLAKENIPLALDLDLDEKKMGGTVKVGKTQLDFFRRNARIEKFDLTLSDPRDNSVVDGNIRVLYADYTIDVLIVGTIKRPRVILQSDPPLGQEQILSVLLYGRTFEDLNANNATSVSAVSAALADRAIALGSLFLLASSPIESIRYDPGTGTFGAKVRIASGTSLDFQTQEGRTQQFGLRKNLKGNWMLNTYFENDSETNKQKAGALLEWYKRY